MHPRDSGAKGTGQEPFGYGWFRKSNIVLAYLMCHRQHWAVWMLGGGAVYPKVLYGAGIWSSLWTHFPTLQVLLSSARDL